MGQRARQDAGEVEARRFQLGLLERIRMPRCGRCGGTARPPVGEGDITRIHQVVVGRCPDFLRVGHRALSDLQRELLPLRGLLAQRADEFGDDFIAGLRIAELRDHAEEDLQARALQLHDLAAEQVQRLDAGGAFVQGGDAGIARELFHAVLGNVAMAAEALQRLVGAFDAPLGQAGFHDRGEESDQRIGLLAFLLRRRAFGNIDLQSGVVTHCAAAFDQRLAGEQHAPYVGLDDDRIGRLVRELHAGQRTALQALARIAQRVLPGAVRQSQALHADAEARRVHHGEHRHQALVRLADQVALRTIEIQHACRRTVDAHLVFDAAATHRIGAALRAITRDLELGHDEERDALAAGGRIGKFRQDQVHDVVRHVVLAGGDEDLGAGDGMTAVPVRGGAGLEQAQVGAAVRFGQAHRAGPGAVDQRLEEDLALPVLAMVEQGIGGAVRQQREIAPREVRRVDHFLQRHARGVGQALAAEFHRRYQPGPTPFDELRVGLLEPRRRGDRAGVLVEPAADAVAGFVERCEHGFGEARSLIEHGVEHVAGRVGLAEACELLLRAEHVVQHESHVVEWRFIGAHEWAVIRMVGMGSLDRARASRAGQPESAPQG